MKTIVIRLSLGQLLRSGQDTIELHIDGLDDMHLKTAETTSHEQEPEPAGTDFLAYMQTVIDELKAQKKERTAEAHTAAKASIGRFLAGKTLTLEEMTDHTMQTYEAWLTSHGKTMNTCSFYMRILKAVYNRAVAHDLVADRKPFAKVFTGNAKTIKRAVGMDTINKVIAAPMDDERLLFARDMFLFSFYTRGMSFVDMAYLKKGDIRDGRLEYSRRKTGQRLSIRWEQEMQQIVDRHPSGNDVYLLPIIRKPGGRERGQYRSRQRHVNEDLHRIALLIGLPCGLTMYVARHSWATIARDQGTPLSVISHAMGHDSEKTTQIYLADIDSDRIDDANSSIIALLNGKM